MDCTPLDASTARARWVVLRRKATHASSGLSRLPMIDRTQRISKDRMAEAVATCRFQPWQPQRAVSQMVA
eukprot:9250106-Alexandrium_andersonii.AAC.1